MANNVKYIQPGMQPFASDVNQMVQGFTGLADLGSLQLASPISTSASPTATAAPGSGNLTGTYKYQLVYVTGWIDSYYNLYISGFAPSTETTITLAAQNGSITIPSFSLPIIAVLIYRTSAGGASGSEKYVGIVMQNTGTTFIDNMSDGSLGNPPTTGINNTVIPSTVPATNTTGTTLQLASLHLKPVGEGGGTAYITKESQFSATAQVAMYIGGDGSTTNTVTGYLNQYDYFAIKSTNAGTHHLFGTDGTYKCGGMLTGYGGFGGLGRISAFAWNGTIASGSSVNISHNLGYKPIVQTFGTTGNVILTFDTPDLNTLKITNYSSGSNAFTGFVYLW